VRHLTPRPKPTHGSVTRVDMRALGGERKTGGGGRWEGVGCQQRQRTRPCGGADRVL
jgi:hypothetical protein